MVPISIIVMCVVLFMAVHQVSAWAFESTAKLIAQFKQWRNSHHRKA